MNKIENPMGFLKILLLLFIQLVQKLTVQTASRLLKVKNEGEFAPKNFRSNRFNMNPHFTQLGKREGFKLVFED